MSDLEISVEMTKKADIELGIASGFPMLYVGRGTYTGNLGIRSQAVTTNGMNEVHLIYIGRYTSIGDIRILCNMNHDYHSVYMGVISDYGDINESSNYRKKVGQSHRYMKEKGMIVIGNDVWIGNNVSIIADVIIGNGAVIGAESVITKDVPPYTIWAGNPARQIGTRFDETTIKKFQDISWWEYSREKILEIKDDMEGNPNSFVQKYWAPIMTKPKSANSIMKYIAFLDVATNFSTFGRIVEQFANYFSNGDAMLILCYMRESDVEKELAVELSEMLLSLSIKPEIEICGIDEDGDEDMIASVDYMILGRDLKNILRISYAFKHGTKIISGVNNPINWN